MQRRERGEGGLGQQWSKQPLFSFDDHGDDDDVYYEGDDDNKNRDDDIDDEASCKGWVNKWSYQLLFSFGDVDNDNDDGDGGGDVTDCPAMCFVFICKKKQKVVTLFYL